MEEQLTEEEPNRAWRPTTRKHTHNSPVARRLRCSSAHVFSSGGGSVRQSDGGTRRRPDDQDNLEGEDSQTTGGEGCALNGEITETKGLLSSTARPSVSHLS